MQAYEQLKALYDEIDVLITHRVSSSDIEFVKWQKKVERFLKSYYHEGDEYNDFTRTSFGLLVWTLDTPDSDWVEACADGLRKTKAIFEVYLEEMQSGDDNRAQHIGVDKKIVNSNNRVFVVHGHDGELKESVARIIEKQGIEAIILSEKANQGRTIIEKFEDYSDVGGAICLFTADDIGREKSKSEGNPRARQNVVFEAGYFMGKLGRDHVVILADNGIELPSDLSGVVYSNRDNWQVELLKELKAMGYAIDFNILF